MVTIKWDPSVCMFIFLLYSVNFNLKSDSKQPAGHKNDKCRFLVCITQKYKFFVYGTKSLKIKNDTLFPAQKYSNRRTPPNIYVNIYTYTFIQKGRQ